MRRGSGSCSGAAKERRQAGEDRERRDEEHGEPAKHRPHVGSAGDEVRERVEEDRERAEREGARETPANVASASEAPLPPQRDGAQGRGEHGDVLVGREQRQLVVVDRAGLAQGPRDGDAGPQGPTNLVRPGRRRPAGHRDLLEGLRE